MDAKTGYDEEQKDACESVRGKERAVLKAPGNVKKRDCQGRDTSKGVNTLKAHLKNDNLKTRTLKQLVDERQTSIPRPSLIFPP